MTRGVVRIDPRFDTHHYGINDNGWDNYYWTTRDWDKNSDITRIVNTFERKLTKKNPGQTVRTRGGRPLTKYCVN